MPYMHGHYIEHSLLTGIALEMYSGQTSLKKLRPNTAQVPSHNALIVKGVLSQEVALCIYYRFHEECDKTQSVLSYQWTLRIHSSTFKPWQHYCLNRCRMSSWPQWNKNKWVYTYCGRWIEAYYRISLLYKDDIHVFSKIWLTRQCTPAIKYMHSMQNPWCAQPVLNWGGHSLEAPLKLPLMNAHAHKPHMRSEIYTDSSSLYFVQCICNRSTTMLTITIQYFKAPYCII